MKHLIIAALMLSSISAFAQESTILVTVDVGGCINANIMSRDANDGDEWELQLIPVDKNGKDITSRIQRLRIDADLCTSKSTEGAAYYHRDLIGPELQASIQLQENQLFRVQLEEKDWGFQYVLGGGNEKYGLGMFTPKMIDPKSDYIKGKATKADVRDCLKMKKIL